MGSKLDTASHRFQFAGRGQMYSMHCRCPGATDPRSLPPKHGTTTMQSCNALLPAEVPSPSPDPHSVLAATASEQPAHLAIRICREMSPAMDPCHLGLTRTAGWPKLWWLTRVRP